MSGFLRKICIFFVFGACLGVSMAQRAVAISPVYTVSLWPNGGTANPDYLTKICRGTINGQMVFARPNSDNTCPTADASYSSSFSLSSSPINEFPQKYANHTDATDGYETFLGYQRWSYLNYIDSNGNLQSRSGGSSGNGTLNAWWAGVTGVTPFVVNYYDGNNNTLVDTQSCTFGDPTGCDVLSPDYLRLTAPPGKYFDGWFCSSGTGTNCRANRYLPSDYATLNTPITPYDNVSISNWPNSSLWLAASRADLRDANGNVVTNMSYEYTGEGTINLYAAWAPYSVTFKCNPGAYTPFVGVDRVQSTYLDENNVQHGIVYGSVIPLDKNFGATSANPLCKSVYYEYDDANGNDQWCSEYLDDDAGISWGSVSNYDNAFRGENPNISRSSDNKKIIYLIGSGATVGLIGSCTKAYLNYSCGSFGGTTVPGTPPNIMHNVGPSGLISTSYALTTWINSRQYPQPALPYKQTNGEYEACSTYTLTPTSGANAGISQTFGTVGATTATDMGYGCCEKPQYAEFKGYEVRRATGELLNNGELIQPGQYGSANCNVSFDNNTDPDTWTPGCDLWPWKGTVYLEAIWEHTPIQITFNHNGATNSANLLSTAYLKYGDGFYSTRNGFDYSNQITQMSPIPQKTGYTFGGYKYCDGNNVCTMVVDSSGAFISGENNLKFTDTDITITAQWEADYTMQYVCSDGSDTNPASGWTFGGTAPTANNPVHYNETVTLPADPYSDQNGCRKIHGTQGNADYCDDCFTFGGWTIDAEVVALEDPDLVHTANSTVSWGHTGATDWCIVNTSGDCSIYNANDTFLVRPKYEPKTYTISYAYTSPGLGGNQPLDYTYTYGTTVSSTDMTAPVHATFDGWCTTDPRVDTSGCTGQAQYSVGNYDHGNLTLYAKWSCNEGYSLSYNGNGDVVCNALVTCPAGQYLPANSTTCSDCIAGNYCPGGAFTLDENNDQGINICTGATYSGAGAAVCTDCPTGYTYNTTPGKTSANQCQIHCNAGTWNGEYTELEYIENTGSGSYIDTGVSHSSGVIKGELKIGTPTALTGNINILGTQRDGDTGYSIGWQNGFKIWVDVGSIKKTGPNHALSAGATHELTYEFNNGNLTLTYDNRDTTGTYTDLGTPNTIHLFTGGYYRSDREFKGRLHYYKLYENNVLVHEFVPARRNNDNALGIYDKIKRVFIAATGTMTAGPDVSTIGGICVNVGAGYYSTGETVNYGSIGTRTACAIGTYSDIPNASSCTLCQNATYSDTPAAAVCTPCPTGYTYNTTSGKTAVTQCQIHCNAGTYVETAAVEGFTQLEYIETTGTQYIDTGLTPNQLVRPVIKAVLQYTQTSGNQYNGARETKDIKFGISSNGEFMCQASNPSGDQITTMGPADTQKHTFILDTRTKTCTLDTTSSALVVDVNGNNRFPIIVGALNGNGGPWNYSSAKYYSFDIRNSSDVLVKKLVPARRNSDNVVGMYDVVNNNFITKSGTGNLGYGADVGPIGGQCENVGAGYYAEASTVNFGSAGTRNACSSGLTTIGYGAGADEASDCGRVLHVGENHVYLRGNRKTDRTLNVKIGNDTYYGNMCPVDINMSDGINHYLKIKLGNTVYSVYDDSAANNCVVPGA